MQMACTLSTGDDNEKVNLSVRNIMCFFMLLLTGERKKKRGFTQTQNQIEMSSLHGEHPF